MNNGITGMDLYRFFSPMWAARTNRYDEIEKVFPDNGVHTDVVVGRDNGADLCDLDMENPYSCELHHKYHGNWDTVVLQDKGEI